MSLLLLSACIFVDEPTPFGTCDDIQDAFDAASSNVRSCRTDDECGQVLQGTSCGCTRDLVARVDADTTDFYELIDAAGDECDLGLAGVCDCPEAYGFECNDGTCGWDHAEGAWIPDCRADQGDPYDVEGASIDADQLTVTLGAGGGCEVHEWVLCWPDGTFAESEPVQAFLEVWHDAHDDPCDAWISEAVVFDLTPLREAWREAYGGGSGALVVAIGDERVTYSFLRNPMLLLLAACHPSRDDTEFPFCTTTETSLALDEATPAGFSAEEVLAFAEGTFEDTLYWDDGGYTPLDLSVIRVGDPVWMDLEAVYPEGTSPAIGILCDDHLSIPATIGFATEDGTFAETFDSEIQAVDGSRATFSVDLVAETLQGTFDPAAVPSEPYDELYLYASGSLTLGGTVGEIAGSTLKDEGSDSGGGCSASSEVLHVATWGADEG